MRVAAPTLNTLRPLENSDQTSKRLIVESIADFHPTTVRQQHLQRCRPIKTRNWTYDIRQFHFDQSAPSNNIVVSTGILFKLSLQMTVQRAQCQTMTPAKLASPQSARSVRTCHPSNLRPTTTTNHNPSFSAHGISLFPAVE